MSTQKQIKLELIRLAEKILFEKYVSSQYKLDLMLKAFPEALSLYLENCPNPPTHEDIISLAKTFEGYVNDEVS